MLHEPDPRFLDSFLFIRSSPWFTMLTMLKIGPRMRLVMRSPWVAACLAFLMCGCHHTGDFGAFFVQQVSQYGGHTRTTNAIPALRGTWSGKSDDEGFQAHLSGVSFADVQFFLKQVYGDPVIKAADIDGQRHGVYGARDIGVAIQYFGETNSIGFICVRAQKWPFGPGPHSTTNTTSETSSK